MATSFVVIGLLRRDADFLFSSEDSSECEKVAEQSVKEGRVEEAFVLEVSAHFKASSINWANPDDRPATSLGINSSTLPPLNPGAGEQEADPSEISEDLPLVNIADERRASGEAFGGEPVELGGKAGIAEGEKAAQVAGPQGAPKADANAAVSDLGDGSQGAGAKTAGAPKGKAN